MKRNISDKMLNWLKGADEDISPGSIEGCEHEEVTICFGNIKDNIFTEHLECNHCKSRFVTRWAYVDGYYQ
jgi:hypothetical protein